MTVYENLFVGRELRVGPFLNRRAMIDEARDSLAVFGVDINPSARMGSLPVGLRQIVEIVKAARTGAQVVMLDEPTSAISEREVEGLYQVVRQLREHGVAMVYTTHKMAEIRAIADRVVVLRDGGLILDKMHRRRHRRRHRDRDDRARTRRAVPGAADRGHRCGARGSRPPGRRRVGAGVVHRQRGRDRRSRWPRRRRTDGAARGDLRRPAQQQRRYRGAGQARQAQPARRGDHRGHGDGARGSQARPASCCR